MVSIKFVILRSDNELHFTLEEVAKVMLKHITHQTKLGANVVECTNGGCCKFKNISDVMSASILGCFCFDSTNDGCLFRALS